MTAPNQPSTGPLVGEGERVFNEDSLREAIVAIWGPAGAHIDVYDAVLTAARQHDPRSTTEGLELPPKPPPPQQIPHGSERWNYTWLARHRAIKAYKKSNQPERH